MLTAGPALVTTRPGQTLIGDKNYYGTDFEVTMAGAGIRLLRPGPQGRAAAGRRAPVQALAPDHRVGQRHLKGQLSLEQHGGVIVRVLQRILALTAAIWHNDHVGQPARPATTDRLRPLIAYDR